MLPLLLLLFIVVPIAELYLIIQVGGLIGVLPTLLLLLADSVVGAALLRAQGRAAWRRFMAAARAGRVPHREALDGGLVIFGGALLLTPGFLTDVLGLLFLVPPTRALARRLLATLAAKRLVLGVAGAVGRDRRPRPRGAYDVEGTATDADPPPAEASPPRLER